VAELWRYPVKSMGGEPLASAEVLATGLAGDRVVQVRDGNDRVLTARTHPALLAFHARLGEDGEPRVDGRPWTSEAVADAVRRAVGPDVILVRDDSPDRFDVLPLTILTDGAIAALGVDRRRLRPNIVIAGAEGLAEREWTGRRLQIGDTVIGVKKPRGRCVMTTYDPDTQVQDLRVLERLVRSFGGKMALDCWVIRPGRVAVGDPVVVLDE